ncbi:hypothetical protein F0562_026727 [Nyssa sinensis]|uniref:Fungal lipase-type domain-containing protein n=1 Tax=Nyssa sinensis TaxID=561372 RepID=A0A5J5BA25_9ASTE|nr:hypothetical protein F0562_026727 [Nyssa sinensis]
MWDGILQTLPNFSTVGGLVQFSKKNKDHRRSIAASLVQGVYILERDRKHNRHGPQALAPPWWGSFHFQLRGVLVTNDDPSIFGAIYEFEFPAFSSNYLSENPPRFVIAFRGTIKALSNLKQDLEMNFQVFCNRLQQNPRFEIAMQEVKKRVDEVGAANIWLAGHSSGSAIALLAGKNMAKMGFLIETYLFNPPFSSVPIQKIKNPNRKLGIRLMSSVITAGVAVMVKDHCQRSHQDNLFVALSAWEPYLFVNRYDHICSEYIGYFEHRKRMMEIGAGGIGRLATQNSLVSLISGVLGNDSEPVHLLPSANLIVNERPPQNFKQDHGIHQWWSPNFISRSEQYQFR